MKYILDDHESHSTQHGINQNLWQEKEHLGKDSLNLNENQWKLSQKHQAIFDWR